MPDINVKFVHPTDGRVITVTVDNTMTATEAIGELLANNFIVPHQSGYELAAGGNIISGNRTFADARVEDGGVIKILTATEAGGGRSERAGGDTQTKSARGIPGLDKATIKNFSIEQIRNSPEAMVMIVHLYDELQSKYQVVSTELERERLRSRDRFVATLLLLVSQVILSIGGNLLTSNKPIAIPVFIAGGLQAGLALYLTFRRPNLDS